MEIRDIDLMMPIKVKPFEHQKKGFALAADLFGIFGGPVKSRGLGLMWEMGCAKSCASIAIAGALFEQGKIKKVLVVAPLSILPVWERELTDYADFPFKATVLKGTMAKKRELLKERGDGALQVIIVNYESAWRLEPELLKFAPDLVIADEAHKLKEARTAQSKAMHHLGDRAKYKLMLTGTPISGSEVDIFSQFRFLNSSIFGSSFYTFRNKYFEMTGYGNHTPVFKKAMTNDFLKKMHSICYRVTKEECLDLPETTEEIRPIELEPKALKLYKQLEREAFAELEDSEVSVVNVLTKLLKLSQLTGGFLTDDDGKSNAVSSAKLDALADILDTAIAEGRKVVVMARFVAELDAIETMLAAKGIGYAVVRGGVTDRGEEVRKFQEDADCSVFIGQIAAAGMGLTLTAASTMVFYSLDFSYSNHSQAQARIHRAGQKKNCHYIYLVVSNSIDFKVINSLRKKENLAKKLVDEYRKGKK